MNTKDMTKAGLWAGPAMIRAGRACLLGLQFECLPLSPPLALGIRRRGGSGELCFVSSLVGRAGGSVCQKSGCPHRNKTNLDWAAAGHTFAQPLAACSALAERRWPRVPGLVWGPWPSSLLALGPRLSLSQLRLGVRVLSCVWEQLCPQGRSLPGPVSHGFPTEMFSAPLVPQRTPKSQGQRRRNLEAHWSLSVTSQTASYCH